MAKKQPQTSREPTKKQLRVSRKEQEQLRYIYMGLGLVGALIIIVLAIGLIQTYIIAPNAPVASVNGEEISTQEYQDRVLYERFILEQQLERIQQEAANLPAPSENDQFTEMLRNQYQQMASQIFQQRSLVDRQTLDTMITDKLIAEEAAKRGITATEEDVTDAIERFLASRAGGLTAAAAEETVTARAEASATAALWTPTPTFTPEPTLESTEGITPTATPADTPTPGPTATLNVIAADTLATEYSEWVNTIAEQTGLDEATYRSYIRSVVLGNKLAEALGEETPRVAEQANARHILVETEEEANDVLARLEAGEDFGELASELSTDPGSASQGGELGFVVQGTFVPAIDEAVFSLPIGEISDPIETQFGWHIVEVLEREEREMSPGDYSQAQRQAFSNWQTEARQSATIEDLWTTDKAPPDPLLEQ